MLKNGKVLGGANFGRSNLFGTMGGYMGGGSKSTYGKSVKGFDTKSKRSNLTNMSAMSTGSLFQMLNLQSNNYIQKAYEIKMKQ